MNEKNIEFRFVIAPNAKNLYATKLRNRRPNVEISKLLP